MFVLTGLAGLWAVFTLVGVGERGLAATSAYDGEFLPLVLFCPPPRVGVVGTLVGKADIWQ